jgi:pyruvate formate lyase activating enzyme
MSYPGRYWNRTEDGRLQCYLCPRLCTLSAGQRGFCFVRQNIDDQMILTTYGRSSGFCLDPVEKKPLNHFLPGTSCLSFGTAGCNLGCKFCQNWDISKSKDFDRLSQEAPPREIAQAALRLDAKSIAFTYNDPVIFAEYAIDTAIECHKLGVKTIAVTAGYISPQARGEFYEHMDAANVDLKGFTEAFYHKITLSHLQPVLDTLIYLKKSTKVWFEITNLMIPGLNDSINETADMCQWIMDHLGPDVPLHFTAFHPDYKMQNTPSTSARALQTAREMALSKGLHYVYTGNVHDKTGSSTYCPTCKKLLIERDWFVLGDYNLKNNACEFCGQSIAGIFEAKPGHWGAKRVAVHI